MKKVTIVIPCYNAEKHLPATLDSALGQTWPCTEILAVDDGSTDGTWDILNRYKARGVRGVRQVNQGPSVARNRGLELASGDYIQYLDADDLLAPDKIERQITQLESGEPGAVSYCKWSHFWQDDAADAFFREFDRYRDYANPMDMLVSMWRESWCLAIHAWLIPLEVSRRAGPWNPAITLNDDFEYFSRVLCACRQVVYCPGARVYYRKGVTASLTSRPPSDRDLKSMLEGLLAQEKTALHREDSGRIRAALSRKYYTYIYEYSGRSAELDSLALDRARRLGVRPPSAMGGAVMRALMPVIGFWNAVRLRRVYWTIKRGMSNKGTAGEGGR